MVIPVSVENWSLEKILNLFKKFKCNGYEDVLARKGWYYMPAARASENCGVVLLSE